MLLARSIVDDAAAAAAAAIDMVSLSGERWWVVGGGWLTVCKVILVAALGLQLVMANSVWELLARTTCD